MISHILGYMIDAFHFFIIFAPVLIYVVDMPTLLVRLLFLASSYVALSWIFFGNKCVMTLVSNKLEDRTDGKNFSERYLVWLYTPIQKAFSLTDDKLGFEQAINIHWMVNLFLYWYYLFYYKCSCN